MRKLLLVGCTVAAVSGLGIGASSAQSVSIELTPQEETTLFTVREAPTTFEVQVGEEIPASVELYEAPGEFAATSTVKKYRYVRRGTRVYVVDPSTRKVVRVITRRS